MDGLAKVSSAIMSILNPLWAMTIDAGLGWLPQELLAISRGEISDRKHKIVLLFSAGRGLDVSEPTISRLDGVP